MKTSIGLVFGMAAFLFCGSAFAEEPKMTTFSFDDDTIEVDLIAPNGTTVVGKNDEELSSLVQAREVFVDEMRKTVDEL